MNKKDKDYDTNYFWYPLKEEFDHLYGWIINILPTSVKPKNSEIEFAAVNLFFMEADGRSWRVQKRYEPYFYVMAPFPIEKYQENSKIRRIEMVTKLDIGKGGERDAYKLVFANVSDLMEVRRVVKNETNAELREADVLYYERFCIDFDIHVGFWYDVYNVDGEIILKHDKQHEAPPQPRILAFDIECKKQPLQFPNEETDEVMMISYMVDGEGFLVTNRTCFSSDIDSFEYSPLEFYCKFTVWNCPNEKAMLEKWFDHINQLKPHIMVTFNGDYFDFPFVERRAAINGISMFKRIGFRNFGNDEYLSNFAPHIDVLRWVKRDSYLPAGSHGLKAVTREKLQYNPLELDPEDICPLGLEDPQRLANYSVSDAYATYYLYIIYVHPFIFSLSTIIPLNADDCLRRGTGTLCESLLMDRAYKAGIIFPNKSKGNTISYWNGHLLQNETYIGGNVEALQSGIYRDDIPTNFDLEPSQYDVIIERVPQIMDFVINTELHIKREDAENIEEIEESIIDGLKKLRDHPKFQATPVIIHLDVAAMYPNIILTNRLQPTAIVNEKFCSTCKIRSPDSSCQRRMKWMWRGDYFPATEAESKAILRQLESENSGTSWFALSTEEQAEKFKERLTEFCRKAYQKTKETRPEERTSIVCMKSHSFYIDTVRDFRDRRYEFKNLLKVWNNKKATAKTPAEREEVKKMIVLYNSLQLAHKALLNSFYGYVMRGGARWKSMEMAGLVTYTGANIIRQTRRIVQGLGKGLELDTDGIWCALPPTFPMNQVIKMKDGSKKFFSFPCSMLNQNVDLGFSNLQYHEQRDDGTFKVRKENSIFFELDGPYHGMFLPAAKEEKKKLKKRYAVFNNNGHITELKGFEIKRRGEWKMIKMLQSDAFISFMRGKTNEEVYQNVADVCRQYIMVLKTKGKTVEDEELLMLLSESSTMSKSLAQYGNRKSNSATTARRLGEILGEEVIMSSKSLKCEYIISKYPVTSSVAERAIPVVVFKCSEEDIQMFLRKWCDDPSLTTTDFRDIVDWDYYLQRLYSTLQKILVIPSYLQGITIKDFDVPPPDWVLKKQELEKMMKKQTLLNFTIAKDHHREIMHPVKERPPRDTSKLSQYQLKLLEIKKKWRTARHTLVERPPVSSSFKDWRVIEIRPTSQPGIVSLFVQTAPRSLQKLDINVPRVFYINSTREAADVFHEHMHDKITEVKTHLPHSYPPDVVTKFTLSETEFMKMKSIFTSSYNSAGVHGVYETNVSPIFRSMISIGASVIKISKNKSQYLLPEFKPTKVPMLPELDEINKLFIYSCFSKNRGMIGLVPIIPGEKKTEAQIFLFYRHDKILSVPAVKNIQKAALQNLTEEERSNVIKIKRFNVQHFQSVREAAIQLQNTLSKFSRTESSVVILNSHLKLEQFLAVLKVTALHQYPIITLDFHKKDDDYNELRNRWDITVFENFTTRYTQLWVDLNIKKECSILLDTPLGNIHDDICLNALDLLFARELTNSNYLLWYSESSEPDIGGAYSNSLISMPGDPFSSLTYNSKGTYLSTCVEYYVEHLATSAVIECQTMIDQYLPQHSAPTAEEMSVKPSLDAMPLTAPVFAILSKFLSNIVAKCEDQSNILTTMILHIGTWIASSSSVLYDPALHSVFFHLLSHLFNDLISHFSMAGITVVFADQSRIILNVGDLSPDNAIIELKQKQLLRWVDLEEKQRFEKLVWLDEYNYQGIYNGNEYSAVWNIARFLPDKLSTALVDFFNDMLLFDDGKLKQFFKSESETLYKLADSAILAPSIVQNPLRSPKDLSKSDFILFINTIFYAIDGIGDAKLNHKIQSLRNSVLTTMHLGSFDARTKFIEPSLSLVVPSVLCSRCLNVRNIDILRDEDILNDRWECPYCKQLYDVRIFERWVFEEFKRKFSAFQTQDVSCQKCNKVQGRKLTQTCEDGGNYANKTPPNELIDFMRLVVIAAKTHRFKFLFECVGQYLKLADPIGSDDILSSFDK